MQHADDDALVALALGLGDGDNPDRDSPDRGSPDRETADHVAGCTRCSSELAVLRSVVRTARDSDLDGLVDPPPQVWQRVVEELDLPARDTGPADTTRPEDADVAPVSGTPDSGSVRRRPGVLVGAGALAAAAVIAVLLVVTSLGGSAGRDRVVLDALEGGSGRGEAVLSDTSDTRALVVDTTALPPTDGFYEVWLLDATAESPVPLGALDDSGQAWLAVPDDVNLARFTAVDVSVEPRDGDATHSGVSVLRGSLPSR